MTKQISFKEWLRMKRESPRISGWHMFVLGKVRSATEINRLRKWCKENMSGGYRVCPERVNAPISGNRMCVASIVWLKSDDDALLFKLRWSDFE